MHEPMKTTEQPPGTVSIQVLISEEAVWGLLKSAFESGSRYWIHRVELATERPDGARDLARVPLSGGALRFHIADDDVTPLRLLDGAALLHGLDLMANDFPTSFADVLRGAADADTGDVLLQLCLFDALIFA